MKRSLARWTPYELIWLLLFSSVAVYITLSTHDTLFGFLVFFSGVLCVVLAARGSILNYPVGLLNTLGYAWISYQHGLFGEMGLYLLFYLPMTFIGFFMWRAHTDKDIVHMLRLSRRQALWLLLPGIVAILVLTLLLSRIEGQNTPFFDATTNILAISATLLMVRRYREQWLCYIALNLTEIVMWSLRAANGTVDNATTMIVMYVAFLINAVYGWYNWSRRARLKQTEAFA